jgi:threonine dehydrogenase-like Zn-dependent dehydrogenase
MSTMKALVFHDIGKIGLADKPLPVVKEPNQVLIKVAACGICGTDVKIMQGKHAYKKETILGHEFNGTVMDIGSAVSTLKKGQRVAVDNSLRCGLCEACRMGISSQCDWLIDKSVGIFQDGGFAEYCVVPESACYKIPDAIDDITATQVETLGTVLNGMKTAQIQPWDSVLILGFGPIGYLFSALCMNVAAQAVVTEIDPFRIEVAKRLGIPVLNPLKDDIEKRYAEITGGNKPDVVIDAVGSQLENAITYVAAGGKILAFGMDSSIQATIIPNTVTRKAVKILGSYIGQNTCLPAIKIFQAGKLNMKPFFTEKLKIEEGVSAFSKLGLDLKTMKYIPKKALKLVLVP